MAHSDSDSRINIPRLILVPSLITLAITLLRLVGELQGWSEVYFNRSAGGGLALVGISWLPMIFGVYFALKLARAGDGPQSAWRPVLIALAAFALLMGSGVLSVILNINFYGRLIIMNAVSVVAIAIMLKPWPSLSKVLLAYGLAARIPVAVIMLLAMLGDWGTHYDVPPPDMPAMGVAAKYFWIGLLPQLFIWIAYTVIMGTLFGGVAAALLRRKTKASRAQAA